MGAPVGAGAPARGSIGAVAVLPPSSHGDTMGTHHALVRLLYPLYCTGRGISQCAIDFGDTFPGESLGFEYWCLGADPSAERPYQRSPIGPLTRRFAFSLPGGELWLRRRLERAYLDAIRPGDVAYLWPACSLDLYRALRDRGVLVVTEMVNSAAWNYQHSVNAAYRRWGLEPSHAVDDEFVAHEEAKIALSDYVFSPSPFVSETLLAAGVPFDRILPTSYGWNPRRFSPGPRRKRRNPKRPPVFLCVAFGSIRKGYAELLDAWARSGVRAKLRLVGPIDDDVRAVAGQHLLRDDVEVISYTEDLVPEYEAADVFVLASHEEGSPVVAYMALAAGLPILASPVVASGLVEDGVQGLVRPNDDLSGFIDAIRRLADDAALRERLGSAARAHAELFTWDRVSAQRASALEAILHKRPESSGSARAEQLAF